MITRSPLVTPRFVSTPAKRATSSRNSAYVITRRPCVTGEMGGVVVDHPGRSPGVAGADGMGVGQADRADELTGIVNPMGARHLAIAVQGEVTGAYRDRRSGIGAGQDGRDPGSHL